MVNLCWPVFSKPKPTPTAKLRIGLPCSRRYASCSRIALITLSRDPDSTVPKAHLLPLSLLTVAAAYTLEPREQSTSTSSGSVPGIHAPRPQRRPSWEPGLFDPTTPLAGPLPVRPRRLELPRTIRSTRPSTRITRRRWVFWGPTPANRGVFCTDWTPWTEWMLSRVLSRIRGSVPIRCDHVVRS